MPSGVTILPRTSLAATVPKHARNVRVYHQTSAGDLVEACIDGGGWYKGKDPLPLAIKARMFTPIAATSDDERINKYIRVFYLCEENHINEVCYTHSKGWQVGDLGHAAIKTARFSQLAAVYWEDQIRLCYQDTNNLIHVIGQSGDGKWEKIETLTSASAAPATRLAITRTPDDGVVRVYYQGEEYRTYQITSLNRWLNPTFIGTAFSPALGHFAATSWGSEIRVYSTNNGNPVGVSEVQASANGVQSWSKPILVAGSAPIAPIAAVSYTNADNTHPKVRVYFQEEPYTIVEYKQDDGKTWVKGATLPT